MSRTLLLRLALAVVTSITLSACATGGPPTASVGPDPTTALAAPASAPVPATSPPSTSPGPTPVPTPTIVLTTPPEAVLVGERMAGEPPVGALGSYTWGDEGTDAPWIVPPDGAEVRAGSPLRVSFDPAAVPTSWIARWAPVIGDAPGDVASSTEGSGAPDLSAPDQSGPWSLRLDARFGEGQSAAWYWRHTVP
jgi:hypothetical protein